MAIRKTNQLDFRVESIQDPVVKEALVQIADAINTIAGVGLSTDGVVKAARGFNSNDKTFKVKLFKGALAEVGGGGGSGQNFDHLTLIVPGILNAAMGYSQYNGTQEWRVMARGTASNTVYFENSTENKTDRISIRNSDAVNKNNFRVVAFYTEYDQ